MSAETYVLRYRTGPYLGEHQYDTATQASTEAKLAGFDEWQVAKFVDGEFVEIVDQK